MPSRRNLMIAKEKKDTIKMLQNLIKLIQSGEFVVVNKGSWSAGLDGKISYKVDIKPFDQNQEDSN